MTRFDITPVLLCGGAGTRLWPLSRADRPKQLHSLGAEETMLQVTALRAVGNDGALRFAAPLVVAGEGHRFQVAEQLNAVGVEPQALILEPAGRNTAPAVALAAQALTAAGEADALMLVMPSDQLIADTAAFHSAIARAAPAAAAGRLVTFGIAPTEPATGYGYIEPAGDEAGVRDVKRFVEKPDAATAAAYIDAGYLWNAGIFLFSASALLEALERHAPAVAAACRAASAGATRDGPFLRPDPGAFMGSPSISIDYAVMERAANVSVAPVDMGWSDVGSWDALWKLTPGDEDGNVLAGEGALIGCTGTLLRNQGGPYVAGLGLENMVVVTTADAVLIAPRARAEDIRKVVDRLEADGRDLARVSPEARHDWGSDHRLGHGDGWQARRIVMTPGRRRASQTPAERAETWVITAGEALVTVDDRQSHLRPGDTLAIPPGAAHRLENPGTSPLELIEVQRGAALVDDDMLRLDDVYGRSRSA